MSTDRINRGILLAMVVIGAIAYALLYSHASAVFRVLVPVGLVVLVGLIVRDVVNARKR
ncbi:hypothetical protein [Mycobacterium sp. HNNTM2301]|uniref:hypothetical protein n=1 Tax=Mycobacterium hainanense TaxID=3289775 RepID=UPI0035A622EC